MSIQDATSIDSSGEITNSVIDSLEFDTSNGYEPSIVQATGNIFAIAYQVLSSCAMIPPIAEELSTT